ncbi:hypothetical protein, partial [Senegalimassilia anaerobia]|uniref:hypothetical protein n=1 Tax=Senegalimassilia anaerobia TaxID=1473216 RepID=UPI003A97FB8C
PSFLACGIAWHKKTHSFKHAGVMNEPCSGIHTTHQQLESAELGGRRYAPACEQLVYYSANAVQRKGPPFLPADVHKMDTRA